MTVPNQDQTFLWGEPGIGKSHIINLGDPVSRPLCDTDCCKEYHYKAITHTVWDEMPYRWFEASDTGVRRVNEARKSKDRKRNKMARKARRQGR